MHDFEQTKRQVLDRTDLLQIVGEHVTLKRSGKRWVGLCCFHNEKTPSFTVSPDQGIFKCFGCGKGGDVFSFVQLRENVSFMESMQILADRAGVELGKARNSIGSTEPSRADIARVNAWALKFFRRRLLDPVVGQSVRDYLSTRSISESSSERFALGLASGTDGALTQAATRSGLPTPLLIAADLLRKGDDGRIYETFRDRLIFPIRDATSRVIGFGGRTLVDDRAKYLNTRQNALFDKGRNLYGVDLARSAITENKRAVIVEGYTDCIAAHQAGFAETVATLGTAMTDAQVALLRRYCDQIILLFDSDKAGEAAAERAVSVALPQCVGVRLARIPSGKDPSEFLASQGGKTAFLDVLNGAADALEFLWSRTEERFGTQASDAAKREAVLDFLRLVSVAHGTGAVDAIQRGLLVNQVAHLLRMEPSEISHLLSGLAKRKAATARVVEGRSVQATRPVSGEQSAWSHLLGVLLNWPQATEVAGALPETADITDPRDRRIAEEVVAMRVGDSGKESSDLSDVLSRFHDPQDVERITELARQGAERGNYQNTLRVALERIRAAQCMRVVERSKERMADSVAGCVDPADVSAELAALREGVRGHRHFAPRRLIRQTVDGVSLLDDPAPCNPESAVEQR